MRDLPIGLSNKGWEGVGGKEIVLIGLCSCESLFCEDLCVFVEKANRSSAKIFGFCEDLWFFVVLSFCRTIFFVIPKDLRVLFTV